MTQDQDDIHFDTARRQDETDAAYQQRMQIEILQNATRALSHGGAGKIFGGFALLGIAFFSGFIALGFGIFSITDAVWFHRAQAAQARVVSIRDDARNATTTDAQGHTHNTVNYGASSGCDTRPRTAPNCCARLTRRAVLTAPMKPFRSPTSPMIPVM